MVTLTILLLLVLVPAFLGFVASLCRIVLGVLGIGFLITSKGNSRGR